MLSDRIRAMGAPHWLVLFGLIFAAWVALYLMAAPGGAHGDAMTGMTGPTPGAAGMARMWAMWALMSAAMMAPTVIPALATYEDLGHTGTATRMGVLMAGYLTVWLGFSLLAAAAQMGLFRAGLLDAMGQSTARWLSVGLLGWAGLYQFSPLKAACLGKCRAPLVFFMTHWDEGPFRNGIRLGVVCLGCCWALMALGFVGGVMNLGFMGLATVLMIVEKLPQLGRWVSGPVGVLLIAAAGAAGFGLI